MALAQSKLTAQGQVSVPAEVRKRLGVGPGSTLEWDEASDHVIVRRAGTHTSSEVHQALFGSEKAKPRIERKDGIRKYMQRKHARR